MIVVYTVYVWSIYVSTFCIKTGLLLQNFIMDWIFAFNVTQTNFCIRSKIDEAKKVIYGWFLIFWRSKQFDSAANLQWKQSTLMEYN